MSALLRRLEALVFGSTFASASYWERRYAEGGDSGPGSYGRFSEFKAHFLNEFVRTHQIKTVIEFGCGDGNQLLLSDYPDYSGFDVSLSAVERCRSLFAGDPTKRFGLLKDYAGERAELALSLDVIFHLVEDDVFGSYMRRLFGAAERYVIVYSSNALLPDESKHVRHREFTKWIETHRPEWVLERHVPNPCPWRGDPETGSFSDFFVFERRPQAGRDTSEGRESMVRELAENASRCLRSGTRVLRLQARQTLGLGPPCRRIRVQTAFGPELLVDPADNTLARSVYATGVYERGVTSLLLSVLPAVGSFWDVGAHVGYHSLLASWAMRRGASINAFEPHPRIYCLLQENIERFSNGNVRLFQLGLSDERCELEIYDEGADVTRAPTFVQGVYERSGFKCMLERGDALVEERGLAPPEVVKVDVEGFEEKVFSGMKNILSSSSPPIVLFEINARFLSPQLPLRLLNELNDYQFMLESETSVGRIAGFAPLDLESLPQQGNVLAFCEGQRSLVERCDSLVEPLPSGIPLRTYLRRGLRRLMPTRK